jgi:AraC-like DNA-binding protein
LWTAWRHYVSLQALVFMRGNLFLICLQWAAVISSVSRLFSVTVNEQCGMSRCHILQSNMYLCMTTTWNMDLLESVGEYIGVNFVKSSQQTNNSLFGDWLRSTELLIDKKRKNKRWVLADDKLDDIGAILEHTPRKSLKRLAQEIGMSKSSARRATQLLKLRSYKTTVIHVRLAAAWSS